MRAPRRRPPRRPRPSRPNRCGGPRPVGGEELHREQVEQHARGAADAVLAAAAGARPVVHRHLGQRHAAPRRHRRDEAVHLAVEAQPARDVAAHRLQRAAVVVQPHAGRPGDEPVGEEGGHALRERVLPAPPPAADHVEVLGLELVDEGRDVGRVVLQVAVRGHDHARRASGRSRPRTRPSARSCGAAARRRRAGRAAPARAAARACRRVLPSSTRTSSNAAARPLERRRHLRVQVEQVLGLVVERNDDRDRRVEAWPSMRVSSICDAPDGVSGRRDQVDPVEQERRPRAATRSREHEARAARRLAARAGRAAARGPPAPRRRAAARRAWPAGSSRRRRRRSSAASRPNGARRAAGRARQARQQLEGAERERQPVEVQQRRRRRPRRARRRRRSRRAGPRSRAAAKRAASAPPPGSPGSRHRVASLTARGPRGWRAHRRRAGRWPGAAAAQQRRSAAGPPRPPCPADPVCVREPDHVEHERPDGARSAEPQNGTSEQRGSSPARSRPRGTSPRSRGARRRAAAASGAGCRGHENTPIATSTPPNTSCADEAGPALGRSRPSPRARAGRRRPRARAERSSGRSPGRGCAATMPTQPTITA